MNCQNPLCDHPLVRHKINCACTDPECRRNGACADCECEAFCMYDDEVKKDDYEVQPFESECLICIRYGYDACAVCRESIPVISTIEKQDEDKPAWAY